MRLIWLACCALLVSGCASTGQDKVTAAATTPLADLNLTNTPIPELLKAAKKSPYALAPAIDCAGLDAAIGELDAILGPDLDASEEKRAEWTDKGGELALGVLRRTAEGVVPFRGWVRKLSGAERESRRVAQAIAAGNARRSFLKGAEAAKGCEAPTTG